MCLRKFYVSILTSRSSTIHSSLVYKLKFREDSTMFSSDPDSIPNSRRLIKLLRRSRGHYLQATSLRQAQSQILDFLDGCHKPSLSSPNRAPQRGNARFLYVAGENFFAAQSYSALY